MILDAICNQLYKTEATILLVWILKVDSQTKLVELTDQKYKKRNWILELETELVPLLKSYIILLDYRNMLFVAEFVVFTVVVLEVKHDKETET